MAGKSLMDLHASGRASARPSGACRRPSLPELPALPAEPSSAAALPGWLTVLDDAVIGLVNVALVGELVIVFLNTVFRDAFHAAFMPGAEETSRLFLVMTAFL